MKKSNYKFAAAALAVLLVLMCLLVLPLCHARGIQNKRAVGGVEQTDFSQQGSAPSAEMQQNELAMQLYRNRQSFSEKIKSGRTASTRRNRARNTLQS